MGPRSKFQVYFSAFFHFFLLFFAFFRIFFAVFAFFALNFSLRFDLVSFCFEAKRNSSLFFRFFRYFSLFFRLFFTFFRLIFVSLWFFHLIFAYFTFVFAPDFWCFASKWIMWNKAFFSLPSETKFSLQFQISLPKRKWGRTLLRRLVERGDKKRLKMMFSKKAQLKLFFLFINCYQIICT